jgi:Amt family ammonium transporter
MVLAAFKDQVGASAFTLDLFVILGIIAVLTATAGVAMMDVGSVRSKNTVDTVVQKIGAGTAAAIGFIPIGYGVWNWQFNSALGIPNPLSQSLKDWWIGGDFLTTPPQNIDPAVLPNADQYVLFYVLCLVFAFFIGAVLHSACMERIKPVPLYVLAAVTGGIIYPVALYLLWGSASVFTTLGVHDNIGGLGVYLPLAAAGVTIAWRLGPRLGKFDPAPGVEPAAPWNVPLIGIGVLFVLANLLMFAIVGGYQVIGDGFYGIAFTTSGIGLVAVNLFCAMFGGAAGGMVLSYRTKQPLWVIAGPFIGYISVTTFNDVGKGWYEFFVGFAAVFVGYGTSLLLRRLRIDEDKLGPMILGPGIFGAIAGGFLTWGTKTGGYPGVTSGKYEFQASTIAPWWQLLGVLVAVLGSALITFVVCWILERTTGLRVTEEQERAGMDATFWSGHLPVASQPATVPANAAAGPLVAQPSDAA